MAFSLDKFLQPDEVTDEGWRRFLENEREYWSSEAGQYHVWWNLERYAEARQRNAEITRRMFSIYCSYRIAGVLAADATLSLLLFPREYFIVGLIGSNFLVFVIVLFYCYVTARTRVREEIHNRHSAILMSARDKALRR
ncbi:MAG TPA: hypothetical protein PKZ65_11525 [Methanoregulaceae archaeon]|nr:hypothetical protein [Methanoregulaceae archaeon]